MGTTLIAAIFITAVVALGQYFYFKDRPEEEQSKWIRIGLPIIAFAATCLIGLVSC